MLAKIAAVISESNSNIESVSADEPDSSTYSNVYFTVQVEDRVHLADIMRNLRKIPDVVRINRVKRQSAEEKVN